MLENEAVIIEERMTDDHFIKRSSSLIAGIMMALSYSV